MDQSYPVSLFQASMWAMELMDLRAGPFNIVRAWHVPEALDARVLQSAVNTLIERHQILKCAYRVENGSVVMYESHSVARPKVVLVPWDEKPATKILALEFAYKFDFRRESPLRVTLLRGENASIVAINQPHIAADAYSIELLSRELAMMYSSLTTGNSLVDATPPQYSTHSAAEAVYLKSKSARESLSHWTQVLSHCEVNLDAKCGHNKDSSDPSYIPAEVIFHLDSAFVAALDSCATSKRLSKYAMLLAAFAATASSHFGTNDVLIGGLIKNRDDWFSRNLLGPTVNMLPYRMNISPGAAVSSWVEPTQSVVRQAYRHSRIPFEYVLGELKRACLIDKRFSIEIIFDYAVVQSDTPKFAGTPSSKIRVATRGNSRKGIITKIREASEGVTISLNYQNELLSQASAELFATRYRAALFELVEVV